MSMMSNSKTMDELVAKFVIKNLSTTSGDQEYESFNEMIQSLYANAATLATTMDGRNMVTFSKS